MPAIIADIGKSFIGKAHEAYYSVNGLVNAGRINLR
jgi:hypothetical protein